eukprot:13979344-Alexandrium_andersonii.AAC.1
MRGGGRVEAAGELLGPELYQEASGGCWNLSLSFGHRWDVCRKLLFEADLLQEGVGALHFPEQKSDPTGLP